MDRSIDLAVQHIQQQYSFLFTSHTHFYYRLKGKNNTNILIWLYKKFNLVPIFSSHILTNMIYSETKAIQKVQSNSYIFVTQISDTLKPRIYKKFNQVCISYKFSHQVAPLVLVINWAIRWCYLQSIKRKWQNIVFLKLCFSLYQTPGFLPEKCFWLMEGKGRWKRNRSKILHSHPPAKNCYWISFFWFMIIPHVIHLWCRCEICQLKN